MKKLVWDKLEAELGMSNLIPYFNFSEIKSNSLVIRSVVDSEVITLLCFSQQAALMVPSVEDIFKGND